MCEKVKIPCWLWSFFSGLFPPFPLSLLPFTWEVRAALALSALGFKKAFPFAHEVNIRQICGGGRMLTKSKEVLMLQLTEASLNLSSCCYKLNMFLSQDVPTPFTSGTKWRAGADILDLFLFGREKKKLKNSIKNIQLLKRSPLSLKRKAPAVFSPAPLLYVVQILIPSCVVTWFSPTAARSFLSVWREHEPAPKGAGRSWFSWPVDLQVWIIKRALLNWQTVVKPHFRKLLICLDKSGLPWFKLIHSLAFYLWNTWSLGLMREVALPDLSWSLPLSRLS